MDNLLFPIAAVLVTTGFFAYFSIARKYDIVDRPNHRTMHKGATIRGGGIVLFLAMMAYMLFIENPGFYLIIGFAVIGLTGFADDLYDLPGRVRMPLQFLSVALLVFGLHVQQEVTFLWLVVIIVLATGTLNAYNFMDGINGMTGGYSLITILTLYTVNNVYISFTLNESLAYFGLTVLIFNFFNFRKKAACFAGDVGSFSIAYLVVYFIIQLILISSQPVFILFLAFYGIDTVFTIIERLWKRENIFKAHRMHLFQVAISKTGMPHLRMSAIYMVGQLLVNLLVIVLVPYSWHVQLPVILGLLAILSVAYITLKFKLITAETHV